MTKSKKKRCQVKEEHTNYFECVVYIYKLLALYDEHM